MSEENTIDCECDALLSELSDDNWENTIKLGMKLLEWNLYFENKECVRFCKTDFHDNLWFQAFNKKTREMIVYAGLKK